MSSTAKRSPAMHPLDDCLDGLDRCLREDAVPEVEDVPGAPRGAGKDVPHLALEVRPRRDESTGVEVALDGAVRTDALACDVERDAPIDADHVAAGAREIHEQR